MRDVTHHARARAARVDAALEALMPVTRKRTAAKRDIEHAINLIDEAVTSGMDARRPRQSRKILNELIKTLARCEKLSRDLAKEHSEWKKNPLDLGVHIERCAEELALSKSQKPRRTAPKQKLAVVMARDLIAKYRRDKKAAALTRHGTWYRLSAILAGNPQLDLFRHMRSVDRQWVPGISHFMRYAVEGGVF
jgi:hypothetical protein